jgi:hypothetical protein
MTDHKNWLDNEYSLWIKALQESTVHNFKEHPGVKRMLGEIGRDVFIDHVKGYSNNQRSIVETVVKIDLIGYGEPGPNMHPDRPIVWPTGNCIRMIYYAMQILARNPSSICEIGGGVGQFYAILRALGWKGDYYIRDLKPVQEFQNKYLKEVSNQTGLYTDQTICEFEMLVSLYALGEFDNDTRQQYESLIDATPHGYIAFNPHSGASDSLSIFENHDIKVNPGIEPGVSIIQW